MFLAIEDIIFRFPIQMRQMPRHKKNPTSVSVNGERLDWISRRMISNFGRRAIPKPVRNYNCGASGDVIEWMQF
jgi:hypothetical protein